MLISHKIALAAVAAASLCGLAYSSAQAATATANLTVQLTITASCTINSATLDFGSNAGTTVATTATDATSAVSVTCTNGSPYAVGMDNGANFSGTRRMRIGATANYVNYDLYTDAPRTVPWTTAATNSTCTTGSQCVTGTGNGSAQSLSIYGRVPATVTAPTPGAYADTVLMTIIY